MARFLLRSVISTVITMIIVSALLFLLMEVLGRSVSVQVLGVFATPEQLASYDNQLGLDEPPVQRYFDWLVGSDWRASDRVGHAVVTVRNPQTDEPEWWASIDGRLMKHKMEEGEIINLVRGEDGRVTEEAAGDVWREGAEGQLLFWGVDQRGRAAMWARGEGAVVFELTKAGMREESDGPVDYIPLRKGLVRGDPGMSLQYQRPVGYIMWPRVRNTLVLAGVAFVVVMPLALLLGVYAGVKSGQWQDRSVSFLGLALTATPEFVVGIFLILVFGIWLRWLPPASIFLSDRDVYNLRLIALPVITLTAVEVGYVARMTRASMVEVMDSPYVRTAIIKGMPMRRVVFHHALRNALMAPITIIMLHINWLIGGIVVVEVLFGFPGLGNFIYSAAMFGDYSSVQAAAMFLVLIAAFTRILGDIIYMFLNPKIRYA
ncbi:MAG: ABC transporter permease [Caldilineaceae bacterium]